MSKEGRKILDLFPNHQEELSLQIRAFSDTMSLICPGHIAIAWIRRMMGERFHPERVADTLSRKPIYNDTPVGFSFSEHLEGYKYLCEQFVVKDFSRTDLLSIAHLVRSYDDRAIFRLGDRCKKLKKFSIPYLCATMDADGAEVVEEIRKENRLDDIVRGTIHLELGEYRPTNILDRMEDIEEERRLRTAGDS